jgi:hypothetical protein
MGRSGWGTKPQADPGMILIAAGILAAIIWLAIALLSS